MRRNKFCKHYYTFFINHVRVTTDERDGRLAGRVHHFHLRRFDDLAAGNDVNVLSLGRKEHYLITRLEMVQVPKYLAKNVVVCRKDYIAYLAWIGRTNVLADTLSLIHI